MKKLLVFVVPVLIWGGAAAQSLEKMRWFNEPEKWEITGNTLSVHVTPRTDFWRVTGYGFPVDDAPFYYSDHGGEFEAKVKISGDYKARYDQAGLMLRTDPENYIKAGIEFVDGRYNLSAVVTHGTSDWSVIVMDEPVPFVWIKAVRRSDVIQIFYSFDDKDYVLMRHAWFRDNCPVMIGLMGACPDGDGFDAKFEDFSVKHLPDSRRSKWLQDNGE